MKFCKPKMAAPFTVRSFQRVTLPRRVSRVVSPCGTRARKLRSAVDGTCNRNITGIWVLLLPMVFCNTKIVLTYCTVRKNCFSDREKKMKFEAEGRELAKFLRSLEQFLQTVKDKNNF